MKIKYKSLTILLTTGILTSSLAFILIIVYDQKAFNLSQTLTVFLGLFNVLLLVNWLDMFLIPFVKGKPALILSAEGLFINSSGQLIPWTEIHEAKIMTTKNSHVIKIFLKDPTKTVIQTESITRQIGCSISNLLYRTPFAFITMFLEGRAVDIYDSIRTRVKNQPITAATR
jgi:hypothetical protein